MKSTTKSKTTEPFFYGSAWRKWCEDEYVRQGEPDNDFFIREYNRMAKRYLAFGVFLLAVGPLMAALVVGALK